MSRGYYAFDFDGTLAAAPHSYDPAAVGEPLDGPGTALERARELLEAGQDVRIFTARASHDGSPAQRLMASIAESAIHEWCMRVFGRVLPVTNQKDYQMIEGWDDRMHSVDPRTGRILA